jgi:hypothetical protein
MSHGIQAQASYTWSKCIDTGSSGPVGDVFLNSVATLPFFSKAERRGPCDFDIKQNFVANYIWDIPSPQQSSSVASWVLGGWQLGGVIIASTGTPFTVLMGGDPLGQKNDDPTDFPDRAAGCNPIAGGINYLNVTCFAAPVPLNRFGNAGRNQLTGPNLFNVDFSVFKNTRIRRISENFNVQFRAEFFNLFNRANFQPPLDNNRLFNLNQNGTPIRIDGAGTINALATDARQIQFGLKLIW